MFTYSRGKEGGREREGGRGGKEGGEGRREREGGRGREGGREGGRKTPRTVVLASWPPLAGVCFYMYMYMYLCWQALAFKM